MRTKRKGFITTLILISVILSGCQRTSITDSEPAQTNPVSIDEYYAEEKRAFYRYIENETAYIKEGTDLYNLNLEYIKTQVKGEKCTIIADAINSNKVVVRMADGSKYVVSSSRLTPVLPVDVDNMVYNLDTEKKVFFRGASICDNEGVQINYIYPGETCEILATNGKWSLIKVTENEIMPGNYADSNGSPYNDGVIGYVENDNMVSIENQYNCCVCANKDTYTYCEPECINILYEIPKGSSVYVYCVDGDIACISPENYVDSYMKKTDLDFESIKGTRHVRTYKAQ